MRQLVFAILLCLVSPVTIPAYAATPATAKKPDAAKMFNEAVKLFNADKYDLALVKFQEALEMSGSPNARLYMARCLNELGRVAEAYEEMSRAMREAAEKANTDQKYVGTRDAAAAQIAIMETKIGKVVIAVAGAPFAIVRMDGKEVPKERVGQPIAVEPKTVVLSASAPNKPDVERQVEVHAGETITVTLEFKAPVAVEPKQGPAKPPPAKPEPTEEESEFGPMRIVGTLALAVGVAGFVTFGVEGEMTLKRRDTLENDCGGSNCTNPKYQATIDQGKKYQTIANVGLGVGIGGIVLGTALMIFGGPSDTAGDASTESTEPTKPPAAEPEAAMVLGPQGGYVSYQWRF